MDMPTAKEEIRMLSEAIEKCGRPIVLSLSPGPAKIEEAWYYETHANMWRITDDFWDDWQLLVPMFERCELWQSHVTKGAIRTVTCFRSVSLEKALRMSGILVLRKRNRLR